MLSHATNAAHAASPPSTLRSLSAPAFVHLRLHSEFSITDGLTRIDQAVEIAAKDGQPALALTDLSNLFGLVKFYKAARAGGVKPIAGADVWISNPSARDKPSRLLLLAQNHIGYLRLCDLLTRAWLSNQFRGRPEVDRAWLAENTLGLIALSGGPLGEIQQLIEAGNTAGAEIAANGWAMLFPNRFYVEVQRGGANHREAVLKAAVKLATRLKLPVVATHAVQFSTESEFRAHEARVCVSEGYVLADQRRPKAFTPEQYLKSQAEMQALFADLPQALANSVEIAKRCNLTLELGKARLPDFPTPEGFTQDAYMAMLSHDRLENRLQSLFPDSALRDEKRPIYQKRLEFEIGTIQTMGFSGYFLIVADFINWGKNNGVPVGPGRGSGAGSLVAYSLGITDLDPLAYNLLFERFLNPERVSMPDFDIDFCEQGRDRVIEYVRNKYGAQSVSQIATFGTMAAKAAVRDIGRVLDLGYNFCDGIAKLIPFAPGKLVTLADARKQEPLLAEREKNEEEVQELLSLAEQVEGLTRSVGKHAGGVLIAPGKLTDFCPLYTQNQGEGAVSQYDKDDVEAVGLVKFDFLGLTTLTILNWAEEYIRQLHPELSAFSCATLKLDDAASYEIFKRANTVAIFQFESRGMRDMLVGAKPDRFEDLIALVALYRPGPMDLIPSFIARKHGKEAVEYPDPRVADMLSETYGIMVYQEQVMQMAQILGGYSLGGADLLRRAMGKKKQEEMDEQREKFRIGAEQNGLNAAKSKDIFDLMDKFAGYGFNKSHAAAYALLSYHTAYLKAHHAAAFYAANMSASMDDTDKVQILAADAKTNGITILPPDVNSSGYRFAPADVKTVRYGLGGIKGSGEAAIMNILKARSERVFSDLFDFCTRVDKRMVNRRTIESLVRAGAFDALNPNRAALLASVGIAMEAAEQAEASASQNNLFGGGDSSAHQPELLKKEPWGDKDRLLNEKQALGYYLSGHLFDAYAEEIRQFAKRPLGELEPKSEAQYLSGVIASVRPQMTRRGKMLVITLDDGTAQLEVMIFNELYEENRDKLKPDEIIVLNGKVANDQFTGSVRVTANKIYSLTELRAQSARHVQVSMNGQAKDPDAAKRLFELLKPYRNGPCPIVIAYERKDGRALLELPDEWRVQPSDEMLGGLRTWLSREGVRVVYA